MKTKYLSFFLLFSIASLSAQVGVNTDNPNVTFEVVGKPAIASEPDGVIAPKMTRAQLIAKTAYSTDQVGAIIYVTDLTGTTNVATQKVKTVGYYYFDGTSWNFMNSNISQFTLGDIKTDIQTTDHKGWVKLDGRAISSLPAVQQSRATTLGLGANLPNATNTFLTQNGNTLGSVSGSNSKTITQSNLPNVNLTANSVNPGAPSGSVSISNTSFYTNASGLHGHQAYVNNDGATNNAGAQGYPWADVHRSVRTSDRSGVSTSNSLTSFAGWHVHTTSPHSHNATFSGNALPAHNHTVPLGSGTALDITPKSLSVNMFIYLGE